MDLLKKIKETLAQQNLNEKANDLEYLIDMFEYNHGPNDEDIVVGTQLLLAAALGEDDKEMKETFFRAIDKAVSFHNIGERINWDPLVASLPSLGKWDLEYVLNTLSVSGQAKYVPLFRKYAQDADPEIRKWADEAITEVEYRIAHTANSQQEE